MSRLLDARPILPSLRITQTRLIKRDNKQEKRKTRKKKGEDHMDASYVSIRSLN